MPATTTSTLPTSRCSAIPASTDSARREVAARSQITKQSVNDLVGHLEQRGYVVRTPDPADGRARILRLTTKGHRLETTINDQARAAELGIAEMLGPRRFAALRSSLEELTQLVEHTPPA